MIDAESSIHPNMVSISSESGFTSLGEIMYISIAKPYKNPRNIFRYLLKPCLEGKDSRNIFIEVGDPRTNCNIVVGHEEQEML